MRNSKQFYGLALVFLAGVILFIGYQVSSSGAFHWGSHGIGFSSSSTANQVDSFSISNVSELSSEGISDIEIIPSDQNMVYFYYDKNYYNNLCKITGHQLLVDFDSKKHNFLGWNNSPDIRVKVYTNHLSSISQEGVGDITCKEKLHVDSLLLQNDGIGSMELNIEVSKLVANNSGVGSIELKGMALDVTLENDGTGSIDAIKLLAHTAKVTNSGVGSVDVNASETLDMNNSGVGGITYTGNAKVLSKVSDGVGSIDKK